MRAHGPIAQPSLLFELKTQWNVLIKENYKYTALLTSDQCMEIQCSTISQQIGSGNEIEQITYQLAPKPAAIKLRL